jgi:CRP-like cAMP-binding protein
MTPGNISPTTDPGLFLSQAGRGRQIIEFIPKDSFFRQGEGAGVIFYLLRGRARLTVVSPSGKEVTTNFLGTGELFGEDSLTAIVGLRSATATAITACTAVRIDRDEMFRAVHDDPAFADLLLGILVARSIRAHADVVDQLLYPSERRLARVLLLMAEAGGPDAEETLIPPVTHETLASMIGTTRSRVSVFMNRFRKLGYIEYHGRIRVRKSLRNAMHND